MVSLKAEIGMLELHLYSAEASLCSSVAAGVMKRRKKVSEAALYAQQSSAAPPPRINHFSAAKPFWDNHSKLREPHGQLPALLRKSAPFCLPSKASGQLIRGTR